LSQHRQACLGALIPARETKARETTGYDSFSSSANRIELLPIALTRFARWKARHAPRVFALFDHQAA
jgi:hypothetical protein